MLHCDASCISCTLLIALLQALHTTSMQFSNEAGLVKQGRTAPSGQQQECLAAACIGSAISAYLFQPHQADRMFYPHSALLSALLSWTRWFCRGLYPEGQNLLTLAKEHMCYVYSTL